MKVKFLLILALLFFSSAPIFACKISISNNSGKAQYRTGDVVEVTVRVQKTHGNCSNSIETTEYRAKNVSIINKGAWIKGKDGSYYSRIRLKLTASKGEKCGLAVLRSCRRGDRHEVIYFKVA